MRGPKDQGNKSFSDPDFSATIVFCSFKPCCRPEPKTRSMKKACCNFSIIYKHAIMKWRTNPMLSTKEKSVIQISIYTTYAWWGNMETSHVKKECCLHPVLVTGFHSCIAWSLLMNCLSLKRMMCTRPAFGRIVHMLIKIIKKKLALFQNHKATVC